MPRFAQVKPKDLISSLQKIGFAIDHQSGSRVILYRANDHKRAVVPMHTKTIPKGTLSAILREAGVTKDVLL